MVVPNFSSDQLPTSLFKQILRYCTSRFRITVHLYNCLFYNISSNFINYIFPSTPLSNVISAFTLFLLRNLHVRVRLRVSVRVRVRFDRPAPNPAPQAPQAPPPQPPPQPPHQPPPPPPAPQPRRGDRVRRPPGWQDPAQCPGCGRH